MTIIEIYRTGIIARGGRNRETKSGNLAATLLLPHRDTPSRAPPIPFRASSIGAALFVSFRVSRRRAFVSGARGGDKSRDALRRTGRDACSSSRATPRIKVAQQPASTRPAFVAARSALRQGDGLDSAGDRPHETPLFRLFSQAKPIMWLSTLASRLDERREKSRVSTA